MDVYLYESDDEYQYIQNGSMIAVQTRAGAASEVLFEHTYDTADEASKDFSAIVAGRAKGKGMRAIIATLLDGTARASQVNQDQAISEFAKTIMGQAAYIARSK